MQQFSPSAQNLWDRQETGVPNESFRRRNCLLSCQVTQAHSKWISFVQRKYFFSTKLKWRSKLFYFWRYWPLKLGEFFFKSLSFQKITVLKGLIANNILEEFKLFMVFMKMKLLSNRNARIVRYSNIFGLQH